MSMPCKIGMNVNIEDSWAAKLTLIYPTKPPRPTSPENRENCQEQSTLHLFEITFSVGKVEHRFEGAENPQL